MVVYGGFIILRAELKVWKKDNLLTDFTSLILGQ